MLEFDFRASKSHARGRCLCFKSQREKLSVQMHEFETVLRSKYIIPLVYIIGDIGVEFSFCLGVLKLQSLGLHNIYTISTRQRKQKFI